MKINRIPFLLLFCFPMLLQAQETVTPKVKQHHVEMSVNATRFLNDLVSFNSRTIESGPYVIGGKIFKGTTALRFGIGGRFQKDRDNEEVTVVRERKITEINVRAGIEKQFSIGKRWVYYFGADFIYSNQLNENVVESDIDIVSTKTTSNIYGGGPIIGFQFNISDRIALWTETSIYYQYIRSKEDLTTLSAPEFDRRIRSVSHRGDAQLPVAIFFAIRL